MKGGKLKHMKLKRIGVLSLAVFQMIFMAIIGLILGIFSAVIMTSTTSAIGVGGLGAGLGFLAIIFFPIIYGIIGFIGGALGALLYNLVAKWIGGIDLEFDQKSWL